MSWDHLSGGPSPPPEPGGLDPESAALVGQRGAPLLEALEAHLPGARAHADATAAYAFAAAVELGFERRRAETVREAARLHDVGLVYVPRAVLTKPPEALEPAERAQLDGQIEAGYALTRGAGVPEPVCAWILRTRERYDGAGPEGLRGTEIAVESLIVRTACAGDLLLTRAGREATLEALRAAEGTELDPVVTDAMVAVLARATAPGPG